MAAGFLADVDGHPTGEQIGMHEPVVDHDVGLVEGRPSPNGDEVGIARARPRRSRPTRPAASGRLEAASDGAGSNGP